jgi:hypothetical protein
VKHEVLPANTILRYLNAPADLVTSYVSLQHLTMSYVRATTAHTGPFHTWLNQPSGQLLAINTVPVYCLTSLLAICLVLLDHWRWRRCVSVICQEPVPQWHSIIIQKTCIVTAAVSVSAWPYADVSLSMTMLMWMGSTAKLHTVFIYCFSAHHVLNCDKSRN